MSFSRSILFSIQNSIGLCVLCLLIASCGDNLTTLTNAEKQQYTQLNHTPTRVQDAILTQRFDQNRILELHIVLEHQNADALDALIISQNDPNSEYYHKYLTPEQFQQQFHPSSEQLNHVRQFLTNNNIHLDRNARGAVLKVRAKAADAEKLFHTELYEYKSATGEQFYAPKGPIEVPRNLNIRAVVGLSSPGKPHSNYRIRKKHVLLSLDPVQSFDAKDIRTLYNIPESYRGEGQRLALVELDGYDPRDIDLYARKNNIRQIPRQDVYINDFDGKIHDRNTQIEVTMDIQLINAMAPEAEELRIYTAHNFGSNFIDIFNEIANPSDSSIPLSNIISCSWGISEDQAAYADIQAESVIFKQMAAQGQTFFAASGDNGAMDNGRSLSVDDPAAQPYVVSVGGTRITSQDVNNISEQAWSNGGGGISQYWKIPQWQRDVIRKDSKSSNTMRNIPDVSLNADPATGYEVYINQTLEIVGGTSCSAPLWAGFAAILNEARSKHALPSLGFIAPSLYAVAKNINPNIPYHDIADNSNNGYYSATDGYDNVTGLGTINGAFLVDRFINF